MSLPYCEKFGFTTTKIQERLQWLELTTADHALGARFQQEIIQPHCQSIIDDFYSWLLTLSEARTLLTDEPTIHCLKKTQTNYLQSLGVNFDQPDYFESRLRVGQAHIWVGLSLSLYQCAYRHLGQKILNHVAINCENADKISEFVYKIIALDMSLAIEIYHNAQVQTLEEILERSEIQQKRLRIEANTDSLTGLANHEAIMGSLNHALEDIDPSSNPVVAIMVDLDHFKEVNDTYGHLVGDKVLIEVAKRLRAALRDFDNIGRFGGEEFLLVLNNTSMETARTAAERIRQHVAAGPINLHGLEIQATISLGLSAAQSGDNTETIVARADKALYAAKKAGRNCLKVAQ